MIDLLTKAELVTAAWTYFRDVQTKDKKHTSLLANTDLPTTELNTRIRETYRPHLEKVYRDPTRYDTYLEQLGITYPSVRKAKPAPRPKPRTAPRLGSRIRAGFLVLRSKFGQQPRHHRIAAQAQLLGRRQRLARWQR